MGSVPEQLKTAYAKQGLTELRQRDLLDKHHKELREVLGAFFNGDENQPGLLSYAERAVAQGVFNKYGREQTYQLGTIYEDFNEFTNPSFDRRHIRVTLEASRSFNKEKGEFGNPHLYLVARYHTKNDYTLVPQGPDRLALRNHYNHPFYPGDRLIPAPRIWEETSDGIRLELKPNDPDVLDLFDNLPDEYLAFLGAIAEEPLLLQKDKTDYAFSDISKLNDPKRFSIRRDVDYSDLDVIPLLDITFQIDHEKEKNDQAA